MSENVCPFCEAKLSESDLDKQTCPSCGMFVSHEEGPSLVDDGGWGDGDSGSMSSLDGFTETRDAPGTPQSSIDSDDSLDPNADNSIKPEMPAVRYGFETVDDSGALSPDDFDSASDDDWAGGDGETIEEARQVDSSWHEVDDESRTDESLVDNEETLDDVVAPAGRGSELDSDDGGHGTVDLGSGVPADDSSELDAGGGATIQMDDGVSLEEDSVPADSGGGATIQMDEGVSLEDADDPEAAGSTIQMDAGLGEDSSEFADSEAGATVMLPDGGIGSGAGDDDIYKTVDMDDMASMDVGDGGKTFVSGEFEGSDKTINVEDLTPQERKTLAEAWGTGEFDAEVPGGMTIKADHGESSAPTQALVIKTKSLAETESMDKFDADYELVKVLGEGGMGIVWHGRQTSIDRAVAIKMLKPKTADNDEQREKFLAEAVVTGDLDHPNIVPIYDVGGYPVRHSNKAALFYSMKKVQGTPWLDVIEDKSLSENIDILMSVCDAVAFAHDRGIVHRDLKPENVMLGAFGEVLVMDWGLALPMPKFRKRGSIVQTKSMGGTPAYMSPEMATGPIDKIGPHSDLYLLGAILYEIVTGYPPHSGKNAMKCLMAAARNDIASTEKTGELVDIAMKAMATKPSDRYASVQDFQQAIRDYQEHSESIVLSAHAEDELAKAKETDSYEDLQRAVFGFEEAYSLWEGNHRAEEGIGQARFAYADSAFRKGDYDLAAGLLNSDNAEHGELLEKIQVAKAEVEAREHRLRTARRIGIGLVAAIFLIVSGASVWITLERNKAIAARDEAKRQEGFAVVAKEQALEARDEAKKQEKIAKEQEQIAKDQTKIAVAAREEEVEQRKKAEKAQEDEKKARLLADEARLKAQEEERKAIEQRRLALLAKEAEEYEAYIARIGLAAAKIDENAFDEAMELLKQCMPKDAEDRDLRNWEWGRLMHLCMQSSASFEAGAPVESIDISLDGNRFASGSWDGKARIWNSRTGEVERTFDHDGIYVYGVAFSPDGTLLATASNDPSGYGKIWNAETGELLHNLVGRRDAPHVGHTEAALSVAFSPDGNQVLTTSYDETAQLWDVQSGQHIRTFQGHRWWVWSGRFSQDGSRIVTASQDGSAIVWTTQPPSQDKMIEAVFNGHEGPVYAAAFSPNGDFVISGGYDRRVLKWNPADVKPVDIRKRLEGNTEDETIYEELSGHNGAVRSVSFSRDGGLIISGGEDNAIKIWDAATGQSLTTFRGEGTFRGHSREIKACECSPDGRWVLSGSQDGSIKRWEINDYEEIRVLRGRVLSGHGDAVLAASFSPDGQSIATAGRDRTARTWTVATGEELQTFSEGHSFLASTARFFPDGKRMLTAAVDNTARIWDIKTGTETHRLENSGRSAAIAISPDGLWIVTGSDKKTVRVWNAESGELVREMSGHQSEVSAVAFGPKNDLVCTGDANGHCRLWDRNTGREIRQLEAHSRRINAIRFLPGGERVLTASADNTVAQWDLETGKELVALVLKHPSAVSAFDISQDGSLAVTVCNELAASKDGERTNVLNVWDVKSGQRRRSFSMGAGRINSISISADARFAVTANSEKRLVEQWPLRGEETEKRTLLELGPQTLLWTATLSQDDSYVVTVGGSDARIWDVATGRERMDFTPHGAVASTNFSPNGKLLVTGSWDNSAKIWNAETGQAVRKLELTDKGGHTEFVNSAVFSPDADGKWVLTSSDDGKAILWDSQTGDPIRTFRGHTGDVKDARFSPDGRYVVTASADKTARIWDVATGEELVVLGGENGHDWAVLRAVFSSDGRRVATGSEDTSAKIWEIDFDAKTAKVLFELRGHVSAVTSVAISPDGKRALTGSRDKAVKIWDIDPPLHLSDEQAVNPEVRRGKEVLTLSRHTQEVTSVVFSPNGNLALSASRDGTAILWLTTDWTQKTLENGQPKAELAGVTGANTRSKSVEPELEPDRSK